MKLEYVRLEESNNFFQFLVIGIDRYSDDLGSSAHTISQCTCRKRIYVARLFSKKMKPIWVAPRATARSTASCVFKPQILMSGFHDGEVTRIGL